METIADLAGYDLWRLARRLRQLHNTTGETGRNLLRIEFGVRRIYDVPIALAPAVTERASRLIVAFSGQAYRPLPDNDERNRLLSLICDPVLFGLSFNLMADRLRDILHAEARAQGYAGHD